MLNITTQHASGEEAVRAVFIQGDRKVVPGDSRGAPPKATGNDTKRSAKGSKRGPKWYPQWVTDTTSYDEGDNDKEADDSNKEHGTAIERDFKRKARQPVDHFEKFLEVTCPNHAYPIRHKFKECSMMKNYMTTGALAKGKKPEGDPAGKAAAPFPRRRGSC
jgi:hypothetical protein